MSHEKPLQANGHPRRHLHIIEDDAVFAKDAVRQFDSLLSQADTKLEWDLLFTDVTVPAGWEVFNRFCKQMEVFEQSRSHVLLSLKGIHFSVMSSFFVNKASVAKYHALIDGQWTRGIPIDIQVRQLIHKGQLKAHITLPFMTSISPQSIRSDIRGI